MGVNPDADRDVQEGQIDKAAIDRSELIQKHRRAPCTNGWGRRSTTVGRLQDGRLVPKDAHHGRPNEIL